MRGDEGNGPRQRVAALTRVIPAQRRARQQQKHKQAEGLAEPGRLWRASQGHGAR